MIRSLYFFTCVSLILIIPVAKCDSSNFTDKSEEVYRQEKFLSLFTIARFPNSACTGTNSYNGTCLTSSECSSYGGTASGSCASGFGVCCIVAIQTCGSTARLNNTYWQNSQYPTAITSSGQCSLFVEKMSSNICQLRLDFIEFSLAGPSQTAATAGQCTTDSFTVSGAANNVPTICGLNDKQHMYVHMTPGTDTFTLNILTTGTSDSRTWNILIRQIPCGTTYTAPDHCLQWFTETSGTLSSFNYRWSTTPTVQHLAYQDYSMCLRVNQGFCGVKYEACYATTTTYHPYGISSTGAAPGATVATSLLDTVCIYDFITIPCAASSANSVLTATTTGCASKLCGNFFSSVTAAGANAAVYSISKPFDVRFYTDGSEQYVSTTNDESLGFCLSYTQQPCLSNVYAG